MSARVRAAVCILCGEKRIIMTRVQPVTTEGENDDSERKHA